MKNDDKLSIVFYFVRSTLNANAAADAAVVFVVVVIASHGEKRKTRHLFPPGKWKGESSRGISDENASPENVI